MSTFVRGTTDPQVFLVAGNTRRLVPDAATLGYLSGGQTVSTLADDVLAAIPQGTPLPSRQDGTLLTATGVGAAVVVYYLSAGQRRRIPDAETQTFLTPPPESRDPTDHRGGHGPVVHHPGVQSVAPADLFAIPEGPALPSRRDGTVYQGSAGAFAFLLKDGHKQAAPDATTLRDAGHEVGALLPISSADLAAIPVGTPLASTSRFLKPPSAEVPLVLLPVRLETRFQNGNTLLLRVYPDTVHLNSFEPTLTPDESSARAAFLDGAQTDAAGAQAAFTTLAQQFGPARAAWIASAAAQPGTKADQWTLAPYTNTLPERWIVLGYQGNAPGQVLAVGSPIVDSLAVGPAPNGPGLAEDDGMRWVSDFDRAVSVGMALRIPLTGAQARGFSRLVVLGLRSTLDPVASAARLGELLQAHHYTDGLELLPHGAPTNNTPEVKSALATRDRDYSARYAIEQGPPRCPARPSADGDRLARALGIDPALLAHVQGADGSQDEEARAINTVLWPATWGYYLEQIVTGSVPTPEVLLPAARAHFIANVRARGHFPALRIGRQPYGVLPVCWSAQWQGLEGRPLDAPLAGLLGTLRATWENSVLNVPRLPGSADPEASLVSILGMAPSSRSYVARSVLGPEYNFTYWRFVGQDIDSNWYSALTAKTLANTGTLATAMAATRLANATHVKAFRPLTDLLVAPAPLHGQAAPEYVATLVAMGWQALRDFAVPPGQPVPLLLLLLRHAALRQYLDTAADLLARESMVQPPERLEAELLGLPTAQGRPTAWELMQRSTPLRGGIGAHLDGHKQDPTLGAFAEFWQSFNQLGTFSAEALDFATREVLDLGSYRLDAWITSLASFRLDHTRNTSPGGGVVLGGYGWLENVRPANASNALPVGGFIHAPSLDHAATAAVLRSAYLSHQTPGQPTGTPTPLAVDLSSERVRLALHLVEGVRSGQPLGALLGYRLERSLHDGGLDVFIASLRAMAPLDGPTPAGTRDPSEAVPAQDVVDGLALLNRFHTDPNFWSAPGLPPVGARRQLLAAAIAKLDDALDAAADLALAESVHQLVRGNPIRAGAVLDAMARGDTPPPDLHVTQTPRAGTGLTHRLFAIATGDSAPGWPTTPRAQAEPRLNAWAAALMGDPTRVRTSARWVDAAGAVLSSTEIGLDAAGLAPLDLLAMPESSGLPGELADRLRRALTRARPATIPASATVELLAERDAGWSVDVIPLDQWLGLLRAAARLVNAARPLEPGDLVFPGDSPGATDTAELRQRADTAEAQLRVAFAALQVSPATDAALLGAAAFGVAATIPAADPAQWSTQTAQAATELADRIAKLGTLAPGEDVSRLQTIFGKSFVVLPTLAASLAAGWPQRWDHSLPLQGGDPLASLTWFQRMARVRAGVGRLDTLLQYAESFAGRSLPPFDVAQLPVTAGDRWLGLDLAGVSPTNRLSLVAFAPTPYAAGQAVAGLVIDEWNEVLPAAQQTTGVSFQSDDSTVQPPQAILLAVRPDGFPEWTLESVEGSVLEALDLAKLRAVDPDALGALGHYLPALYFAYNTGSAQPDTVSTDFNVALQTMAAIHPNP